MWRTGHGNKVGELTRIAIAVLALAGCSGTPRGEATPSPSVAADTAATSAATIQVAVYLVTTDETGKRGIPFGHFGEVLVAVPRTVPATADPLTAALAELISMSSVTDSSGAVLSNHWMASSDPSAPKLHAESVVVNDGVAVIRFVGRLSVAGIGDVPRILGQLDATAKQFPNVKKVEAYLNGEPLEEAIAF